jgi:hypothetical protein
MVVEWWECPQVHCFVCVSGSLTSAALTTAELIANGVRVDADGTARNADGTLFVEPRPCSVCGRQMVKASPR